MNGRSYSSILRFLALSVLASVVTCGSVFSQTPTAEQERGQKLYSDGHYREASTVFEQITRQRPNDFDAWYYLGLAYVRQKEFKLATKSFERALKLRSDSAPARTALAFVYLVRNKLKDALRESERALALDDNSAEAHLIRGFASFYTGSRDEALRQADLAIKLNDKLADAYLLRSQALVRFSGSVVIEEDETQTKRQNRYAEAAIALKKYLELAPTSPDKQLWNEQFAALNFHLSLLSKETRRQQGVFNSREVTTKVRLTSKPAPDFTAAAEKNGVSGTVVLRALFSADASVKHIVVLYGLPDGLTWAAVNSAKRIKFVPATLNGKPVSMVIQLEYNFN